MLAIRNNDSNAVLQVAHLKTEQSPLMKTTVRTWSSTRSTDSTETNKHPDLNKKKGQNRMFSGSYFEMLVYNVNE